RADLRRSFERRTQRAQIVRGGFCPGDEGFEGCGDIAPARVDGNDRIVLAAATFQETDHWLTPRECARDRSELGPELWQSQITRGVKMKHADGPRPNCNACAPRPGLAWRIGDGSGLGRKSLLAREIAELCGKTSGGRDGNIGRLAWRGARPPGRSHARGSLSLRSSRLQVIAPP